MTRNNTLLNAARLSPGNGSRGIRCIVCEEGSPVCGGAQAEVPPRNRPLRNQLKCSLYRISFPLGFCSCTRLVKDADTQGPDTRCCPAPRIPALRSPSFARMCVTARSNLPHKALVFIRFFPSKQGVSVGVNRAVYDISISQGQSGARPPGPALYQPLQLIDSLL